VQRVLREIRIQAAARARRPGEGVGRQGDQGRGARVLLQAAGEVLTWLEPDDPFPPIARALKEPDGLLAAGGDLSQERLLEAYRHGIFPWFSRGQPILWWSP